MWTYDAPLKDMRFVMERVLNAPQAWARCPAWADLDLDTVMAVLDEANRFARDVVLPLNAPGDLQGCTRDEHGRVSTPSGYREAYAALVEGGWPALPCSPEWGGQGLPLLVDAAVREMLVACNQAWMMYPDLLHGAYETLEAHGSETLKQRYLGKIATGEWLAAMALTEPGAGTDLGALRTRADPAPDFGAEGTVRVTGQKIFISGGDHDLTDNLVHLVLCRLHGADGSPAPAGTKGLSLALVPKHLPDGTRNAMHCDGLEKKMGIKGSATCAMRYEGATGWLVGEPHRGLQAMFLMMNSARLHVGLQGLGHQEMASQNAARYAAERVQMGRPIAQHAAVRHILLRAQALTEALRVLSYRAALAIDDAHHHPEPEGRAAAGRVAALLTPLVKAFGTHQGFHTAVACQQVYGGYGYVQEYGIEQSVRDARIAMIYEGTNEVQAIDLLMRKVLGDAGQTLQSFLDECVQTTVAAPAAFREALRHGVDSALEATAALRLLQADAAAGSDALLAVADDFLAGLSHTLIAWTLAARAQALTAVHPSAVDATPETEAMRSRLDYARVWLLPQGAVHWQRVMNAAEVPMLA